MAHYLSLNFYHVIQNKTYNKKDGKARPLTKSLHKPMKTGNFFIVHEIFSLCMT